jgi:hypothetical protein
MATGAGTIGFCAGVYLTRDWAGMRGAAEGLSEQAGTGQEEEGASR